MDVLDERGFKREVDTIRALHQTVVSLRAALERSRVEIEELKERIWTSESCELALQTLSVENHILRQKIISVREFQENTTQNVEESVKKVEENVKKDISPRIDNSTTITSNKNVLELPTSPKNVSPRQTVVTVNVTLKSPRKNKQNTIEPTDLNKTTMEDQSNKNSDTEGEEVDDIELIFTTDETTAVIKEELVSIADVNEEETECDTPVLLNYKTVDFDTSDLHLSCEDKDLDDDVFQENETSDNVENKENESQRDKSYSSFESRSLDKDESFDKFDDLHKMWSNNSVLVETDISKCGIVDPELPVSSTRRNTCPNPVPYRPIMHREALAKHNNRTLAVKFSSPRPILNENQPAKTESEAQTDISALPSLWKSESYLAHKVSHQFTTLPSKFPMPISQKCLRLSEKTKEARRVLLSDINFTSMVPELSRSADHLYQEGLEVMQTSGYGQYLNPPGPQMRRYNTGDSLTSPNFLHSQKFAWSPSDYSNFSSAKFDNSNTFLNRYSTSHWRQNVPASFDNSRFNQGIGHYRSVPNSPTRSRSVPFISSHAKFGKSGYGGFRYVNGSLPELHGDLDSGDSTDSLVEEAEQYVRSSIDCIVSGRDIPQTSTSKRRSSAPCPGRDSSPPRHWQPFLPHGIKDLRSDNWVKVIGPEGKIRGGRVRYVGYVLGQPEPFVGIELATNVGNSDGSFNNRRYFECLSNHALFIPFKKVVMGWRN